LNGRGAKGIDSLEGKSGLHPSLMEDLATGRISAAQTAQRFVHSPSLFIYHLSFSSSSFFLRIRHKVKSGDGFLHSGSSVHALMKSELEDILQFRQKEVSTQDWPRVRDRYERAFKIAQQWIVNYVHLNFKSLGSYTAQQFNDIVKKPDALLTLQRANL
jgi:hypothetical protein